MKLRFYSILLSSFFTLMLFSAATYISCNKDKCVTTTCYNGGACSAGLCTCTAGYEGINCTTESRQKFLGNWQQNQSGITTQGAQFAISINGGIAANSVLISNFDNYFTVPVSGNVTGADSLVITAQTIQGSTVSGTAVYISAGNIQVNYTVTNSAGQSKTVNTTW